MITPGQTKTIGMLSREIGVPEWLVRRTVDSLGVEIPRLGPYRAITAEIELLLLAELRRRGLITALPVIDCREVAHA